MIGAILGRAFPAARSLRQVSWGLHTPKPAKIAAVHATPFPARHSRLQGNVTTQRRHRRGRFHLREPKVNIRLPSTWCQVRFVCRSGAGQSDPRMIDLVGFVAFLDSRVDFKKLHSFNESET